MKILTIGTSLITSRFIDAVNLVDGAEIVASYSRDIKKAQALLDNINYYDDYTLALQDPNVDTVYVASPNTIHYQQTKDALLANKHVICEKPFVSNTTQLKELIEIAQSKGLFLFEAITTLHLPNFMIIKENLEKIGKVKIINCNYSQYSSRYNAYLRGEVTNIFDLAFDGGALRDVNIYNLHFCVALMGQPLSYHYYANRGFNGVDTSGVMILDYGDAKAILTAAKDSSSDSFGLVQGEKGTLEVFGSSLGRVLNVAISSHVTDINPESTKEIISIDQQPHMSYEVKTFMDIINNNDTKLRDELLNHSLMVLEILEKASQYDK